MLDEMHTADRLGIVAGRRPETIVETRVGPAATLPESIPQLQWPTNHRLRRIARRDPLDHSVASTRTVAPGPQPSGIRIEMDQPTAHIVQFQGMAQADYKLHTLAARLTTALEFGPFDLAAVLAQLLLVEPGQILAPTGRKLELVVVALQTGPLDLCRVNF